MNSKPKVWILSRECFGDFLLGPALRVRDIAFQAVEAGYCVHILAAVGSKDQGWTGVEMGLLQKGYSHSIGPDDSVVICELLPSSPLFELLKSGHPFHWDVYGLSLPETMSFIGVWPSSRSRADSRRKDLRYVVLSRAAYRIWVSHSHQTTFLAALLARTGRADDIRMAYSLPSRVIEAPMGCSFEKGSHGSANPYLDLGISDPVFLWGGGIWKWFDTETVIRAFRILADRSVPATLFFLSGRNEATSDYDSPLSQAIDLAKGLGIFGKQVVFNSKRVGREELAPWLAYATAGVMGNCPTLESRMSWRTRYLDLLSAGRPLVVSGPDPLAEKMERAKAALMVPVGDPKALADAMASLLNDPILLRSLSDASGQLGEQMSNRCTLSGAIASLGTPGSSGPGPRLFELVRYVLGR